MARRHSAGGATDLAEHVAQTTEHLEQTRIEVPGPRTCWRHHAPPDNPRDTISIYRELTTQLSLRQVIARSGISVRAPASRSPSRPLSTAPLAGKAAGPGPCRPQRPRRAAARSLPPRRPASSRSGGSQARRRFAAFALPRGLKGRDRCHVAAVGRDWQLGDLPGCQLDPGQVAADPSCSAGPDGRVAEVGREEQVIAVGQGISKTRGATRRTQPGTKACPVGLRGQAV